MAGRETYTRPQLQQYYSRVGVPEKKRVYDVSFLSDDVQLAFLALLFKHELCSVPWENLTQHYSWHRVVNVSPSHLFRKIVHHPGRGGYCMEANSFFHTVLVSLGFNVYMAGARIYSPVTGRYGGWTHCVNIVTIGREKYMVDGGFGGQGPCAPLMMEPEKVQTQISPAQMKLLYKPIPQHLDASQRVWIYQHRYSPDNAWMTMYCFTDLEFLPEDIASMNFAPWLNRQSFFTHKVVAVRFTTSKESDGKDTLSGSPQEDVLKAEIDGALTINHDVLKWRRHGKKVLELVFKSEEERLRALEKYFGIYLQEEDRVAIRGTAAAIGASAPVNG